MQENWIDQRKNILETGIANVNRCRILRNLADGIKAAKQALFSKHHQEILVS